MKLMLLIVSTSALLAFLTSFIFYSRLKKEKAVSSNVSVITAFLKQGATTFFKRQYVLIFAFFAILFSLLLADVFFEGQRNFLVPFALITSAFWPCLAGYFSMKITNHAVSKIIDAAKNSQKAGFKRALDAGAIGGLLTAGFVLIDLVLWTFILMFVFDYNIFGISSYMVNTIPFVHSVKAEALYTYFSMQEVYAILIAYCLGALLQALFAKIGGGIFSNAAYISKCTVDQELQLNEDDLRNPGGLTKLIGSQVCDISGNLAVLYAAYAISIIVSFFIGLILIFFVKGHSSDHYLYMPYIVSGIGLLISFCGLFFLKLNMKRENDTTVFTKARIFLLLLASGVYGVLLWLHLLNLRVFLIVTASIFAAVAIEWVSTSVAQSLSFVRKNMQNSLQKGPINTILKGLALGFLSASFPIFIVIAILIWSFLVMGGFTNLVLGFYGLSLAAVGVLSFMPYLFSLSAAHTVAANAASIAKMLNSNHELEDKLNYIKATGNGRNLVNNIILNTSTILISIPLLYLFLNSIIGGLRELAGKGVYRIGHTFFSNGFIANAPADTYDLSLMTLKHMVEVFRLNILNPQFLGGLLLGLLVSGVLLGLLLYAVETGANRLIAEIRQQFSDIEGIWTGDALPQYNYCIKMGTITAQKLIIIPAVITIVAPVITGLLLGIAGVVGLFLGVLCCEVLLAIGFNYAALFWKNSKQNLLPESPYRASAMLGDTIGETLSNTVMPSLGIFLKIMIIVSIICCFITLKYGFIFV